jgi:hypothetical protein
MHEMPCRTPPPSISLSLSLSARRDFFPAPHRSSFLDINGVQLVNDDGLHGMVERCGNIALTADSHVIYVTGWQAGGGVGMEVTYSGPDTGGSRKFMRSGAPPAGSNPPPKYYPKCDPANGVPQKGFFICMFRSEVWLSVTPSFNIADTGLSRVYFVGKAEVPTIDLRDYNAFRAAVPAVPDVNYAWAIYGNLPIASAGQYKLCITSDDGSKLFVDGEQVTDTRARRTHARTHSRMRAQTHARGAGGGQRGAPRRGRALRGRDAHRRQAPHLRRRLPGADDARRPCAACC